MNQDINKIDYLKVKQLIDQRSYNKKIFNNAFSELPKNPIILDTGFGLGSLLIRCLKENKLKNKTKYIALDKDKELLIKSKNQIIESLNEEIKINQKKQINKFWIKKPQKKINLELKNQELLTYLKKTDKKFDMIIGNSFIDLIDLDEIIKLSKQKLKQNGIFYQSLVYDGYTGFYPKSQNDEYILRTYNDSMKENGDIGKKLLLKLSLGEKFKETQYGCSDWIISPPLENWEKTFVKHILNMINKEVIKQDITQWIREKINQLNNEELVFISHQIDVLTRLK